jgi:hypothetical protein
MFSTGRELVGEIGVVREQHRAALPDLLRVVQATGLLVLVTEAQVGAGELRLGRLRLLLLNQGCELLDDLLASV